MQKLHEFLIAIKFQGSRKILESIKYAIHRDWLNWKYARKVAGSIIPVEPGDLQDCVETNPGNFLINFSNFTLELSFLKQELLRIRWYRINQEFHTPIPYAINKNTWETVQANLIDTNDGIWIKNGLLSVHVSSDGRLAFSNQSNEQINIQLPPRIENDTWILNSLIAPEECVYGLGEQSEGFNLRGSSHLMWNTDAGGSYNPGFDPLYMPLPAYMGLHKRGSYMILHENTFPGSISFDKLEAGNTTAIFQSPNVQYYFINGNPATCLEKYTELTGRAPLPPLWSLGYHQSRWGYKNDKDIRDVLSGFTQESMPISAIHLDIDYMHEYRVFTINPERFPHLDELAKILNQHNIHLVSILDPGVKVDPDYEIYKSGLQRSVFCKLPNGSLVKGIVWPGISVFPDFTNPETREWWKQYYKCLIDVGIDGIWHDMNEPTSFSAWGGLNLPESTGHYLEGRHGNHLEAHNVYALQMNRSGYEACQDHQPNKRPWLISRSGWVGNQRYSWNWTGDTDSTWEAMKMTISTILGLGLSGIPYSGPDIGGFSGNPSPELYLRWFQMASFMPFFRTHSATGTHRREPYIFGEPYRSILRSFLHLRYQLLPYFYTLAWEASQIGAPLLRPLFWNEPENDKLWDIDDEFLLGDLLLIAPILEEHCTSREVFLPTGEWFDFWGDSDPLRGPIQIEVNTNLDTIPVFVRSGCLLPMAEINSLVLHIYPPTLDINRKDQLCRDCQLYSDAGDGYGNWRLDKFQIKQIKNKLTINRAASNGENAGLYPFPYNKLLFHLHGLKVIKLWVDQKEALLSENRTEIDLFNTLMLQVTH